eukprot:5569575-Lingulodinium_polyedra.AAC.1
MHWRGAHRGGSGPSRAPSPPKEPRRKKSRALIDRSERIYNRDSDGNELTNRRGKAVCPKYQT